MIFHQVLKLYDAFSNEKYKPSLTWGPPNEFVLDAPLRQEEKFKLDENNTQTSKHDQSNNRHSSARKVR